jgi:hypothetical protein
MDDKKQEESGGRGLGVIGAYWEGDQQTSALLLQERVAGVNLRAQGPEDEFWEFMTISVVGMLCWWRRYGLFVKQYGLQDHRICHPITEFSEYVYNFCFPVYNLEHHCHIFSFCCSLNSFNPRKQLEGLK